MTQHTPTPWVEEIYDGEPTGWINDFNGNSVVEYAGCGSHEADWPNPFDRKFMITAVNSHDALVEALEELIGDRYYPARENDPVVINAREKARYVIAKAKGE